ncbi:MAG: glycosyltransferase [Desulfobacteraceae bacterium]|nr:MAG: glycosyltransferase [Desulfobacteraceae bacterium]
MPPLNEKFSDAKNIDKIAMLSIHSSPAGELGTRDTGGMSVYIRELAKEFGYLGILVDVFTLSQTQSSPSIISLFNNVRLINLNVKSDQLIFKENLFDYLPAVLQAFNQTVKKESLRYDLIHSHYWLSGILGNQIKQIQGIPHVTTFHTMGAVKNRACLQESEPDFRIKQEKELAAACDRIIASTRNEAHELISLYHAKNEKIGVVPAGVNLELFQPMNQSAARRKLGLHGKEQLLLYVGRYVPVKGLDRLLKIMPHINNAKQDQHRFKLLVIGGDDENEQLPSVIRGLNIEKAVALLGRKDQALLPAYYSAADMLVVPSYHESFCLAGLESLACGTPVVTAPVGGLPEIINPTNGYVLEEPADKAMAAAIIKVADSQRQGRFNPNQIRASVLDYSWKNTAKLMLAEYQKVTKGNRFENQG